MKKRVIGLFLLIGLPLVAIADNIHVTVNSPVYSYPDNREFKESVYVCVLTPFNKMYAGVDVKKHKHNSTPVSLVKIKRVVIVFFVRQKMPCVLQQR